jgi:hypothetical protein
MKRRGFIKRFVAAAAGLVALPSSSMRLQANENPSQKDNNEAQAKNMPCAAPSMPSLQCPKETEIVVVWALGCPSAGWVEYGEQPSNLNKTAHGSKHGLMPYDERFMQIKITGLKPNTRYYYRTASKPTTFHSAYNIEQAQTIYSNVYSFETCGESKDKGSFVVINDTHNKSDTMQALRERIAAIGADYTIWNGDLVDSFDNAQMAANAILRDGAFASEKPMLFVAGNHDYRGVWARCIEQVLPSWKLTKQLMRHLEGTLRCE